jgi:hypothetical protein
MNRASGNGHAKSDATKIRERIEREAHSMLGVSARTAFRQIADGKLRGTIAEAELTGLRDLLKTT